MNRWSELPVINYRGLNIGLSSIVSEIVEWIIFTESQIRFLLTSEDPYTLMTLSILSKAQSRSSLVRTRAGANLMVVS